jgi:flagellar motor switch protein FliN
LADNEAYEIEKVRLGELDETARGQKIDQKMLADIPVEATVELGKAKISLREILELAEGSIIGLDRVAGEPLDIKVGGQTVATGEVVAVDDNYGIRITRVNIK